MERDLAGPLGEVRARVTYQDPCHLVHGQGIRRQPRDLLRRIPGIELVEMPGSDRCCGSAGIYNLTQPGYSRQVLDEKMAAVRETGAALVVAPNPGCMLQIASGIRAHGLEMHVRHLIDLLDQAYAAAERGRPSRWLPLDPPGMSVATVGGIIAANRNGPRRLLYGPIRDMVIGIRVALPTGEVIKAGGKVVKNVAGYDLTKLFIGSLGAAGVSVEATFKISPSPGQGQTILVTVATRAAPHELTP